MQSFGPLTLTANVLTQVSCSPASATVYIGNDSPYDVLVSFAVSPPPLVTSANGTADWPAVVQAFHHCVLPTPGNISSPQGTTFAGSVWLLPLDTRNVRLAQNGTVSATANAWVVACLPGEQPPDAYAAPRQTDMTSQQRVIALPVSAFNFQGSYVPSASAPSTTVGQLISLSNIPIDPAGPQGVVAYLFSLSIGLIGAVNVVLAHDLQVQATTGSLLTPVGSPLTIYTALASIQGAAAPYQVSNFIFTPSFPVSFFLNLVGVTQPGVSIVLKCTQQTPVNVFTRVVYNIQIGSDNGLYYGHTIPGPGAQNGPLQLGSPGAFLF